MKHHPISTLRLAALAGSSLVTPAFAVVNIDYVTVGNAGNAANFTQGESIADLETMLRDAVEGYFAGHF